MIKPVIEVLTVFVLQESPSVVWSFEVFNDVSALMMFDSITISNREDQQYHVFACTRFKRQHKYQCPYQYFPIVL